MNGFNLLSDQPQPRSLPSSKATERGNETILMPTGEQIQPNHLDLSSTTNFSLRFPVLNDTISKIEQLTDFEEVKLKLKFADDLSLSAGTRTFFKNNVKRVLEAVDAELTAVLGAFWTNLRAQS